MPNKSPELSPQPNHPLLDSSTRVIIQGITGKEGQRACAWMEATGISVLAGVTPGKGGQTVEGRHAPIPVYDTVAQAVSNHPEVTLSCLYVPPRFVKNAALEAISAGLPIIHILGEGVPSRDTLTILEAARAHGTRVVGPSSIGFARTGVGAIGSMGGGNIEAFLAPSDSTSGLGVAVISKSGGMANTIANMLSQHSIAQTYVIGIGGDRLIGTTFADLLPDLASDSETAAVVIVGEIGGAYEEMLAQEMMAQNFSKPVVAFISGLFAETLPQGVAFGHAGAIVSKSEGRRDNKIAALEAAGAQIAHSPTDIITILKGQPWFKT